MRLQTDVYLEHAADQFWNLLESAREQSRESVRLVVWLTGYSIALGGLLVGNVPHSQGPNLFVKMAILSLGLCVVAGALHRVFYYSYETRQLQLSQQMHGYFLGARLAHQLDDVVRHEELDDSWDRATIVAKMESNYGSDYAFLEEYDVDLDRCRQIYQGWYEQYLVYEDEALAEVNRVLKAYLGKDAEGEAVIDLEEERDLERVRSDARAANDRLGIATPLYYVAIGAFVVGTCFSIVAAFDMVTTVAPTPVLPATFK